MGKSAVAPTFSYQTLGSAVHIDRRALQELNLEPEAYGEVLASQVFSTESLVRFFARATAAADAEDLRLRCRLRIVAAPLHWLHELRWELLAERPGQPAPRAARVRGGGAPRSGGASRSILC
jgi:hypothetical protein